MRLLWIIPLALYGCASGPEYNQQRAAQATPVQLCEAYYYGPPDVQRAAAYEREYRNLDCNALRHEAALMYQQRGQRNAAADIALQNYLMSLQRNQPAPAMNCTSQRIGDRVSTTCR